MYFFYESNIFRRRVLKNITHTDIGRTNQCPEAEVGGLCSGQEGQHQKDVLLLGVSPWKLIGWISTFRLLIHSINTPSSAVRSISPCRPSHTYTGYCSLTFPLLCAYVQGTRYSNCKEVLSKKNPGLSHRHFLIILEINFSSTALGSV